MSVRRATVHDVVEHCDRLAREGQRLRPDRQPIAAFDADGTLWGPDVAELLWDRLIHEKALHPRAEAPLARALRSMGHDAARDPYADFVRLMELFREGRCPEEVVVRFMLQGLAGLREEDVYHHAGIAVEECGQMARVGQGESRRIVDELRSRGFRVVVVSGSPRWAVEVAARPLGVEAADIIAGQVAVVGGVLTDGIIEPLPWGRGKIQALLKRCGAVPRVCLGNSLGDLAMLRATSALRILVNPTDELRLACEEIPGAIWSVGIHGDGSARPARRSAAASPAAARATAAIGAVPKPPRRPTARS